jgi:hypothetical protein
MPTKNNTQCVCRVPVDETVTPAFGTAAEGYDWLKAHGVTDLLPIIWAGRPYR